MARTKKSRRGTTLQAQERIQLTPEVKDAIIASMTRKALQGNTTAAKLVLDEYHAKHTQGGGVRIITLSEGSALDNPLWNGNNRKAKPKI